MPFELAHASILWNSLHSAEKIWTEQKLKLKLEDRLKEKFRWDSSKAAAANPWLVPSILLKLMHAGLRKMTFFSPEVQFCAARDICMDMEVLPKITLCSGVFFPPLQILLSSSISLRLLHQRNWRSLRGHNASWRSLGPIMELNSGAHFSACRLGERKSWGVAEEHPNWNEVEISCP